MSAISPLLWEKQTSGEWLKNDADNPKQRLQDVCYSAAVRGEADILQRS
jgi:hypothetical protein